MAGGNSTGENKNAGQKSDGRNQINGNADLHQNLIDSGKRFFDANSGNIGKAIDDRFL